ncbi:2-dehydro-3-deoxygluconokinase [Leeuwenhoekiella aestuarii]|uniref:2-dehydro-3-deoxygluconokinase n=1 Tax=Leeuwenhoekiella aestuarii TaxID=2249426 RepID=A0A4Q0NWH6_9FLAO|nr:sugar kinase [Leeuwenhoekiella aestuarii]RXG12456.1 2-dehydro-3-deoxygluconokinase [Leeuwenhoekiella aestuarii]RXG16470.1 2-dehydro-3-deoxygluconokinase [Leeuwenhoekiella aestuarii]
MARAQKIITFGEVLLRLSPAENRKLSQAKSLDFFFGGTEMNVGASLAFMGESVKHITAVSNDIVGDAALSSMRQYGLDVSSVQHVDHPIGQYLLEVGSGMRSSQIAYNRLNGSFANIQPDQINWNSEFEDASLFHWTGITPAISENAYQALKAALISANAKGLDITADPAYRSNLWQYGRNGQEVLKELVSLSTIFIGGVNEINEILGTSFGLDRDGFIEASKYLMTECPNIKQVFDKIRTGLSASWQKIYGRAFVDNTYLETDELEITQVVDRIGTGDAYAAGLIYGLHHLDAEEALNFANAACALKHTILGDVNLVSVAEITEVMQGNTGGRIKR